MKTLDDKKIVVVFGNGVEKEYDVKSLYSSLPQFKQLESDRNLFGKVQIDAGGYGLVWNDDLDLAAEEIWENGIDTGRKCEIDPIVKLADNLAKARMQASMTQAQLANATGIYQADISKIERGLANPSVSTLKRLADGMGMELQIEFVEKV